MFFDCNSSSKGGNSNSKKSKSSSTDTSSTTSSSSSGKSESSTSKSKTDTTTATSSSTTKTGTKKTTNTKNTHSATGKKGGKKGDTGSSATAASSKGNDSKEKNGKGENEKKGLENDNSPSEHSESLSDLSPAEIALSLEAEVKRLSEAMSRQDQEVLAGEGEGMASTDEALMEMAAKKRQMETELLAVYQKQLAIAAQVMLMLKESVNSNKTTVKTRPLCLFYPLCFSITYVVC